MSYLPSFDYDLFISYAHVDNQPGGRRGWVHRFQEELVLRLDRRLGRIGAAKIWWDSELDGSQVFGQKIRNTIDRSALFLALTSEGYLRSDYCRDELNRFCEKAEAEPPTLIVGDRARVFNVLLDNIPHTRWPARYGGTNGYPFYDEEVGLPLETRRKPFDLQLNRMVKVICEMLEAMRGAPEEGEEEEPFTVFIADTATTLRNVRSRLCNELQGKGVRIADRVPPPHPLREHEEAVAEKVKSADLCVHLLDAVPGTEIIDEPSKSYLERQAELSLAHARWQFVWVPSDLTAERIEVVEDEAHRNLLRRLEAGPAAAAPEEDRRDFSWFYFWRLNHRDARSLEAGQGAVSSVGYSNDGKVIAAAYYSGLVALWDAASGREIKSLQQPKVSAISAALSPEGKKVVIGGDDNTVHLWNTESADPPALLGSFKDPAEFVAHSHDGKLIAAATRKGELKLWLAATRAEPPNVPAGSDASINSIAFTPDEDVLVVAGSRGLRVLDLEEGREGEEKFVKEIGVTSLAFDSDTTIALGDQQGTVTLYEVGNVDKLGSFNAHRGPITSLSFLARREDARHGQRRSDRAAVEHLHAPPAGDARRPRDARALRGLRARRRRAGDRRP